MTNTDDGPFSPANFPHGMQSPDPLHVAVYEARLRLANTVIAEHSHFVEMKRYMREAPLAPSSMDAKALAVAEKEMTITHRRLAEAMGTAEYQYQQAVNRQDEANRARRPVAG